MRVLVLGRLFSGLKEGLKTGLWTPHGVPAFYKLVEGLKAAPDCKLLTVLATKENDPDFTRTRVLDLDKPGRLIVLGWRRMTAGHVRRIDVLGTELMQLTRILWEAMRFRPDVIYATYAMVIPAAILCRIFRRRVVLRLMGLFPHHRAMLAGRFSLLRWALRSPFQAVVCTEDGSDPGELLSHLLHPGTELVLRLNGCDVIPRDAPDHPIDETRSVLFVGRLEAYKGCDIFVDAALASLVTANAPVRYVIVGDGPMRRELEDKVRNAGDAFVFTGAIPHHEVTRHLAACDIYVSVNLNGNLSNANLEALAAGACMMIPTSDPSVPIDTSTDRLLEDDVVVRYDRGDLPYSLARGLAQLLADPARIAAYRTAARKRGRQLLKSWSERIEDDIALLRRAAAGRGNLANTTPAPRIYAKP